MGGAPGAGDDRPHAAGRGLLGVGEHLVGHAVGADHLRLVGTPKRSSTATAACIVDQSLADPISTATLGATAIYRPLDRWRTGSMRSTTRSLWIGAW